MTSVPPPGAARVHYEKLLGSVYTWMAGGFEPAAARQRELLAKLGAADWPRGLAVDLGAGSGFQAVPLAELGYDVLAIDLSARLLGEIREHAGPHAGAIRTVEDDLLEFPRHLAGTAPALVVCMGDTLAHLPTWAKIEQLFSAVAAALAPGGRFVLTFRDLLTDTRSGDERFLLVRADDRRILSCFLEYTDEHVRVHDLLHEKHPDGWRLTASSYPKLRLNGDRVSTRLAAAGLLVLKNADYGGFVTIVAQKPARPA